MLLIATAAFLPNTFASRSPSRRTRAFWILTFSGMFFWLSYQGMWNYFEVFKRQEVPNPFTGDVVLFLHLVPMMAGLALLPHLDEDERDARIRTLDFALLLIWWVFLYVYAVIPWQTVHVNETAYSNNFNSTYLTEKMVLLVALVLVTYHAQAGWRLLYAQLLGASALYASSSYIANYAIAHQTYYTGSVYDIPLAASCAPQFKTVAASFGSLDHALRHACAFQSSLVCTVRSAGTRFSGCSAEFPQHSEFDRHDRDGHITLLAAKPARR